MPIECNQLHHSISKKLEIASFPPKKKKTLPLSQSFSPRKPIIFLDISKLPPKYRIQACEHRCSETLRQAQNLITSAHRPVANGDDYPTTATFRGTELSGHVPSARLVDAKKEVAGCQGDGKWYEMMMRLILCGKSQKSLKYVCKTRIKETFWNISWRFQLPHPLLTQPKHLEVIRVWGASLHIITHICCTERL